MVFRRVTVVACSLVVAGLAGRAPAQTDYSQRFVFRTLAGESSIGSANGSGTAARFNAPVGTAVDSAGNVYVADSANHVIRKITPAGVVTTFAGSAGKSGSADGTGANARFWSPWGLAIDAQGTLYVADAENHTVRKITSAGAVTTLAGRAGEEGSANGTGTAARFKNPQALAVDSTGAVFVADGGNALIRRIAPDGAVTTYAGRVGETGSTDGALATARLGEIGALAFDADGNLLFTQFSEQIVRRITPAGQVTTVAGRAGEPEHLDGTGGNARFGGPWGLATDASRNVYVSDVYFNVLRKIATTGAVTTFAGSSEEPGSADGAGGAARFFLPTGLSADPAGALYVADYGNNTVRKVASAGAVSTLAGLSFEAGLGAQDGTGAQARFLAADGLAVSPSGDLYVADTGNHTIRKITPAGVVTTFAGQAGETGFANGTGAAARFNYPVDVAVDAQGNVFVADAENFAVRKITPTGEVSTFAGPVYTPPAVTMSSLVASVAEVVPPPPVAPNEQPAAPIAFGSITGLGWGANGELLVVEPNRVFRISPAGVVNHFTGFDAAVTAESLLIDVAMDAAGNYFASDFGTGRILRVTPSGGLSTWSNGLEFEPYRLAVHPGTSELYVTEGSLRSEGMRVARVLADGQLELVGGATTSGTIDGPGSDARFTSPSGIAVDGTGNLYVSSNNPSANVIRKGEAGVTAAITGQPQSQSVSVGTSVTFSVTVSGNPAPTYQWFLNGIAINGATGSSYTINNTQTGNAGNYTVTVTNAYGAVTSAAAGLTVTAGSGGGSNPGGGSGSGGGGGGGAPSHWFLAALAALAVWRSMKR